MLTPAYLPFFQRLEKNVIVLQAVETLLHAIDSGHVCLALTTLSRLISIERSILQHALIQSVLVGKAGEFSPFILDQNRLYLARLWFEETQVARLLSQKIHAIPVEIAPAKEILDALFPSSSLNPDWQKVAAALSILHRLTIISGGPGTGKTTTLTRLLVAMLATQPTPLVIHLAAPTGKAAARMQTAIQQAKRHIPEQFASLLKHIPDTASTLHRLLRLSPLQPQGRTPLLLDILVVDEASMIDLPMMNILLQRLPETAHLILLGDQNQLASVEPGSVFASLCEGQGYSSHINQTLSQLTGFTLDAGIPKSRLSDAVVHLKHSYRFSASGGIGALARATHQGKIEGALQVLLQGGEEVIWLQDKEVAYAKMRAGYQAYFEAAQDLTIPMTAVFALWEQFRVLTPLREGSEGSIVLNQKVGQMLAGVKIHKQSWYSGRAIMITENSPGVGLFNGDIGIVREEAGEIWVYFTDDGSIRRFTPGRLPHYETAFVMTVHKSQGSEFDEVLCYLPDMSAALMTRALFYTAVTRARKQVTIYGQISTLHHTLMHTEQRESGLADRLRIPLMLRGEQLSLFDD
jgi:exodeoxyribonuclease V alpha subunit